MILLSIFDYLDAQTFFEWFVAHASYLYVFVFMAIESSFIPFPSEVVVPPAVYLAVTAGGMDPVLVVLVATAGAMVGALVNYYLSRWLGRPIIYKFADSRLGHALLLNPQKVEKAEKYFDEHGAKATFFGRLIPAVRQLISIPAGLARMSVGKFCIYTALGAGVWNCILGVLGWWLGNTVPLEGENGLFAMVEKYNTYLTIAGYSLLAIIVLYLIYKALTAKKSAQATSTTDKP